MNYQITAILIAQHLHTIATIANANLRILQTQIFENLLLAVKDTATLSDHQWEFVKKEINSLTGKLCASGSELEPMVTLTWAIYLNQAN